MSYRGQEPCSEISTTAGRIFKIIRDYGPLSGTEIVRHTGLAKSTVSAHLDRLREVGLLREEENGGGKRHKLKVAESAGYVVGIALGQSHVRVALCDLEAEIIDSEGGAVDLLRSSPEEILNQIINFTRELERRAGLSHSSLFGVGIGLPCPVDYQKGIPVNPPVMPGWDRFPVAAFLKNEFTCPVFVDNDVNVMALAERDKGGCDTEGRESFILVKTGTGVGAGIVIEGQIYRGAKGAAGDIGHIGLEGDTRLCRCGNIGCLEMAAGGRALRALGEAAASEGRSSFLAEELASGKVVDASLIARGAASGDEECIRLLSYSGSCVGEVLAKIVNFFNPSLIIISGGLTKLGDRFIASIRESIYRRSTPLATVDLIVKKSSLLEQGGTIGAAILVLDEVFSHGNVHRLMQRSN
ncbi:ROK family transcriptional regulator [Treponema sp.]